MAKRCYICGNNTIFYIWSSSRNFPRGSLIKAKNITSKREKKNIKLAGYPVCINCYNKLLE